MPEFEKIYLEILPSEFAGTAKSDDLSLVKIESPSYEEYRAWHDDVGRPFDWHLRARINDRKAIEALLAKSGVEMLLLCKDGEAVGYALTEDEGQGVVEVSDFGFPQDRVGAGLGQLFFPLVLERIIKNGAKRIWLSTRSTNDPRVVGFYEKFGMSVYKREIVEESF